MTNHEARSRKFTRGPWVWEAVQGAQCITEHTLKGPNVLCRYWYDKPPSADAKLIASVGTAATTAEDMGYDGQKVIEELPRLLEVLKFYRDSWIFDNAGVDLQPRHDLCMDEGKKAGAILASCRVKEPSDG